MQVTNVRTTVVGTPWRDLVFVELETDTGLVGVGEVRPVNKTDSFVAVVEELAGRYVVGADPFDTERLAWAIERLEYGRPSEHSQSALAAFDIASWDLIGQTLGVPIWKLLGGRFRDRVPAYANGWYRADLEPDAIATLAVGVVARGYRAMKLDPFGAASVRLTAAARRRALGDRRRCPRGRRAGCRPDDRDARAVLAGRRRPDRGRTRAVRPALDRGARPARERGRARAASGPPRRSRSRPASGSIRSGMRQPFIEGGNVDIVQADLTHFGGFTGMRRLAGWTEAHYLALAPHNVGGPVATAANVHFAAATRNVDILEHFNDFADPWVSELVDEAPRVDPADGCFALSERPGLGLRLDHDACARHPRTGARLQLFVEGWQKRDG